MNIATTWSIYLDASIHKYLMSLEFLLNDVNDDYMFKNLQRAIEVCLITGLNV